MTYLCTNYIDMGLPEKKLISLEAYLALEASTHEKHEYFKGEIFAMAGATVEHNRISSNTLIAIGNKLKGKNCAVFTSDLRVNVKLNSLYTYPDITVVCGEIHKVDGIFDTVTNPTVIIEVLSESTKDYDRGSKFMLYRGLQSLKEYVLIDSTGATHVEKYFKNDDIWQLSEYTSLSDIIKLQSLEIQVLMSDVYAGVHSGN